MHIRFCLLFALLLWAVVGHSQAPIQWKNWLSVEVIGSGPDLLLIPGYGSKGEVWDTVVADLSSTHRCHVVTLHQFTGQRPADTALLAGSIQALQQYCQEQTTRPYLLGHSIGGFLSLYLGQAYPKQFAGIISVDALPYLAAAWSPQPQKMPPLATAQQFQGMDSLAFWQQTYFTTRSMITDSAAAVAVTNWSKQADRYAWGYLFAEFYNTDLRQDLAKITVPTLALVASGMGEAATMPIWQEQYAQLPQVTFAYHPSARHFIQLDDPQWLLAHLTDFFSHATEN